MHDQTIEFCVKTVARIQVNSTQMNDERIKW